LGTPENVQTLLHFPDSEHRDPNYDPPPPLELGENSIVREQNRLLLEPEP